MIIGDLEYFMGSLPHLTFRNTADARRRVSMLLKAYAGEAEEEAADLLDLLDREAEKFLSAKSATLLRELDLNRLHHPEYEQKGSGVLADFSRYMRQLKEAVRQLRLRRRSGASPNGRDDPNEIQLAGNPLEEEVQLMKYQWDKLDELAGGHYADLDALIIYRLKLMVLLRWWQFDTERGFEQFLQRATNR